MFRESFNVKGDPNVLAARYNQISTLLYWSRLAGSLLTTIPPGPQRSADMIDWDA